MSKLDKLRMQVARLLNGGTDTGDLDELFLWLRGEGRTFGNHAVADLSNFVAHGDQRDRGLIWKGANHMFVVAQYQIARLEDTPVPATASEVQSVASSAFALMDPAEMRKSIGISHKKAKLILAQALEAVTGAIGRRIQISRELNDQEERLLKRFTSVLVSRSAFNGKDLVSETRICLEKNHFIRPGDKLSPELSRLISIYAVEKMHLSLISLPDGQAARLEAGLSWQGDTPDIEISAKLKVLEKGPTLSFPVYEANCNA